jgi:hypothetical protein
MNEYFFTYDFATGDQRWKGKADVFGQDLPAGFGIVAVTEAEYAGLLADVPLASLQAGISAQVNAQRDKVLKAGYLVTSGTLAGETLQVGDPTDQTNWLTSVRLYEKQIALGNGAVSGAKFRTLGNDTFTLTFNEGLSVLDAMALWGASVWAHSWDLKDDLAAASTALEALQIDYTAGWPS